MSFVAPTWQQYNMDDAFWATKIAQYTPSLAEVDADSLQQTFVQSVQDSPQYGSHFFHCRQKTPGVGALKDLPEELLLGYSHTGLTLYGLDKVSHAHFSFAEIFRWGGSSSGFSLILAAPGDKKGQSFEWVVVTSQAQDMAAIILDHIRALMKK